MKITHACAAVVAVFALAGTAACEVPDDSGTAADRTDTKNAAKDKTKTKDKSSSKPKSEAPKESALRGPGPPVRRGVPRLLTGFSAKGLIDQLEYEGFSTKLTRPTASTPSTPTGTSRQLCRAKEYLDYDVLLPQGLVDQLMYEGYTKEQAEYGVNKVGL
jgi:hypothetical protein